MCKGNSKCCCGGGGCTVSLLINILLVVGGLNWGLVGAGMLAGGEDSWNLVNMIFGSWPAIEAVVYVVVGLAALASVFGCKCSKCKGGVCESCVSESKSPSA